MLRVMIIGCGGIAPAHIEGYEIISYLHTHYQEELTLDELAKRFYTNKYSLCALFREATGSSPNQYLIQCRLQKAMELLLKEPTVETVCRQTG